MNEPGTLASTRPRRIPPPPGPHGLGPVELPLATAIRAHDQPRPLPALTMAVPELKLRAVRYHLARWLACGLIERVELAPGWPGYRWSPSAPASAFDVLPIGTCPRCGSHASPSDVPHPEGG